MRGYIIEKGVETIILAGTAQPTTPLSLNIRSISIPCSPGTKWADGEPGSKNHSDGDGRVLLSEIGIDGVTVVSKAASHDRLPTDFSNEIINFLDK